jgi:polyketide biosynthesis enoyl-CoA hydratase PksI
MSGGAGVVHLEKASPKIAVVTLEDRDNRNMFSRGLVTELMAVFRTVAEDPALHAVVVQGYDHLFSAGGTQQELLDIFERKVNFTDLPLYRLFLDCPIPVIAAMQGHALGGGLAMGLFADLILMSEESIYSANFMKYGFTPGMGSTLILQEKLGTALASEMLLTAANYHGGELARRGVPFPVVKRRDVLPTAMRQAADLAEKPLVALKLLKRRLTARIIEQLPAAIEEELKMHEISFAQPEVRHRIETLFGN